MATFREIWCNFTAILCFEILICPSFSIFITCFNLSPLTLSLSLSLSLNGLQREYHDPAGSDGILRHQRRSALSETALRTSIRQRQEKYFGIVWLSPVKCNNHFFTRSHVVCQVLREVPEKQPKVLRLRDSDFSKEQYKLMLSLLRHIIIIRVGRRLARGKEGRGSKQVRGKEIEEIGWGNLLIGLRSALL